MTVVIGLFGIVLGVSSELSLLIFTTRSSMGLALEHSYDQELREERLDRYQGLFHISGRLPRYSLSVEEPSRKDLQQFRQSLLDWYFDEAAGGMFLTPAAKEYYIKLLNRVVEVAYVNGDGSDRAVDSPVSAAESQELHDLASELRHQLAEDVGVVNSPRLRWARPNAWPTPTISLVPDAPDHSPENDA